MLPISIESVLYALAFAILGWLTGLVSAILADRLMREDGLASQARGRMVRDPLVQGALAITWGLTPLLVTEPLWRWLGTAVLTVPLVQVAVTDLRHRYVYTAVAAVGLVFGLLFGWVIRGEAWWTSLVGAAVGLLLFAVMYGLGRLIYRGGEPLARGDITIAAMVGAIAGSAVLTALVLGVVFSGLGAVWILVTRRTRQAYMPYGPGLCLGGLVTLYLQRPIG